MCTVAIQMAGIDQYFQGFLDIRYNPQITLDFFLPEKDIARLRAPKRLAAQKRENLYPVRKRAEEHANQKNQRTKILSRERRVSGLLHHDPVICVAVWSKNFSVSTESALSIKLPSSFLFWTQNVVHTSVSSVTHGQGVYLERLV